MRCFVSINFSEEVEKEIRKIQSLLPKFSGKKTEPGSLHLTLKFLREVDENKINGIIDRLREINSEKFDAEIDSIGFFDNRKSRKYERQIIIWLRMLNCEKLQKKVDNSLKSLFEMEKRFMSHITIARVKDVKDKKRFLEELKKIKIPKIKFEVSEFYLMKSDLSKDKPTYTVLEKFKLN